MTGKHSHQLLAHGFTYCDPCGKRSYLDRKSARRAARIFYPGDLLNAYRCPVVDQYWHIGHLLGHERGRS